MVLRCCLLSWCVNFVINGNETKAQTTFSETTKPMMEHKFTKKKSFQSNLFNLLFSAGFPNEGEAALLARVLEFVSLMWPVPAIEYNGPNDDRFMFRAATDKTAGGKSNLRLLAATGVERLNWSDKFKFWMLLLRPANRFWSRATDLLRKFVFKRLVNIPSDPSPNKPDDVANPLK